MRKAMLPWQWLSFQASFLQEWHLPFLGFTNIIHSLIVDEETKHHMGIIGTLRYGDYGLRLDTRFSSAKTLGRVHNEWHKNAKLRPQTTDNRLRTKSEGQLYTKQTQNVF